ncbi:MAG: 50S ribosomal protein L10 [Opitutales bacterium]|nr:50S ribosomal protein L10 [Opitutales bacterium]
MQTEKQYFIKEVGSHLDKSSYCLITDYTGITVEEVEGLRIKLEKVGAEFHVVKNRILKIAAQEREFPEMAEWLTGQTAIIVGGENPSESIKILEGFIKEKKKVSIKGGVLDKKLLSEAEVSDLGKLPSLEVLRAQLLGTLNAPAQQTVTVLMGVPQAIVNILKNYEEKLG